jgi:hypothetical protein
MHLAAGDAPVAVKRRAVNSPIVLKKTLYLSYYTTVNPVLK